MQITAAVTRGPERPFTLEQLELPAPHADEVLVRLVACGVCHTDLAIKGMLPDGVAFVLGHEGAGVVEEVGADVDGVRPGDHVVLSYRSCGSCPMCSSGQRAYCARFAELNVQGTAGDGGVRLSKDGEPVLGSFFGQSSFATYALASADNTVVVPDHVDLSIAAPLGCGVQTGAGAVLEALRPDASSALVVYGAGGVGLSAVMAARACDVGRIVVVDPVASRRELAERLGATGSIDPTGTDVLEAVRELTGGGATHALDTTGLSDVIGTGAKALRARGTLVVVGLGLPEIRLDVQDLIGGGKTVRGCIEGDAVPKQLVPRLVQMWQDGRLPLEQLVTAYPFAEIERAVADSLSGVTVKPVLQLDGGR